LDRALAWDAAMTLITILSFPRSQTAVILDGGPSQL